jgi:hypothetical protein
MNKNLNGKHNENQIEKHYEKKTENLNGELWKTNISKLIKKPFKSLAS